MLFVFDYLSTSASAGASANTAASANSPPVARNGSPLSRKCIDYRLVEQGITQHPRIETLHEPSLASSTLSQYSPSIPFQPMESTPVPVEIPPSPEIMIQPALSSSPVLEISSDSEDEHIPNDFLLGLLTIEQNRANSQNELQQVLRKEQDTLRRLSKSNHQLDSLKTLLELNIKSLRKTRLSQMSLDIFKAIASSPPTSSDTTKAFHHQMKILNQMLQDEHYNRSPKQSAKDLYQKRLL